MNLKDSTLVSIIIPTYNRVALLYATIGSIKSQSFSNFECLVVDDGSTDETESVVKKFASEDHRIKYLKRPSSMLKGANSCRNFGFENSSGEYIKWLDSDDIIEPTCLEQQLAAMENNQHDVCFSQTGFFTTYNDGKIKRIDKKVWGRLLPLTNAIDDHLKGSIRWQTGAGLWRRSSLYTKPYLEGLMNSQEWLMHFKFLTKNVKIVFIDEPLCLARVHEGSMSHRNNKRSAYYYNQCVARIEALHYLKNSNQLNRARANKLLKSFAWNHLFVAYKGGPLKAISLIPKYATLLKDLILAPGS